MGQLTLEVPRCKDGSFSTKLFQRYQRSEKALVLALMEWGLPRRIHAPSQEDHH
ncbi:transposase [Salinibacter sp.]|uniref:transposase n=1 Tax=Salinibacter sp. TaxID=2065818 RepID=UPI002342C69D